MDYTSLAQELLTVRAKLLQVPANQQLSQMVRGEMFVLNYLFTHEGAIHPKELSRQMAVTIASLLNHMEQKQLLLRRADPEDNRQVIVELTEQGRQTTLKIREQVIQYLCAMLEALGPEDAQAYIRIQKKIWNNFQSE